jgi:triacylglycerol lipase
MLFCQPPAGLIRSSLAVRSQTWHHLQRACASRPWHLRHAPPSRQQRLLSQSSSRLKDSRIRDLDLGHEIADEYAKIRDHYDAPKNPIVLAHGLLGFSELRLAGRLLPPIHYWHGIKEALEAQGAQVYATAVPPSDTIAHRAEHLGQSIVKVAQGRPVNVIAHSMGGLDARQLISDATRPGSELGLKIASLVTIATPHRGSSYADHVLGLLGDNLLPAVQKTTGLGTGAFEQLTTKYMAETFNPATPDSKGVRYFSYGAMFEGRPGLFSPFRTSWKVLMDKEGPNDGLVSVQSSRWGDYKGTILAASHLDLINWSNRLRFVVRRWMGEERT